MYWSLFEFNFNLKQGGMNNLLKIFFAGIIIGRTFNKALAQNAPDKQVQKVVIIRHGEKPDKGDHLSWKKNAHD
jgi:hypothetical protein